MSCHVDRVRFSAHLTLSFPPVVARESRIHLHCLLNTFHAHFQAVVALEIVAPLALARLQERVGIRGLLLPTNSAVSRLSCLLLPLVHLSLIGDGLHFLDLH